MIVPERLPTRLSTVPIIEATFQVRFAPVEPQAHELLPGLLLPRLRDYVPHFEGLGPGHLPVEILQQDPSLWYQHTGRLTGPQYNVGFGPRVLSLSANRPYPGWPEFRKVVEHTLDALRASEQARNIERFSLKYRHCLEAGHDIDHLSLLNVNLSVGNLQFAHKSARIAVESTDGDFQNLVSVLTRASVSINATGEQLFGVMLDVDTIHNGGYSDFWNEAGHLMDAAHKVEKETFFGLLTRETLESLGPVWE